MGGLPGRFPEESKWSWYSFRLAADRSAFSGDVAWEMAVTVVSVVYLGTRFLERRFFGR
jgi:hypothetical protein